MAATSEPAPGSVNAIAARQPSSEASRGSQRCFCSSVPEPQQRPHREHRRPDRRREPGAAPRELLRDQARRDRRDTAAAVLARDRVRRQAERRRLREQLGRAVLALVPLRRDRAAARARRSRAPSVRAARPAGRADERPRARSRGPPGAISRSLIRHDPGTDTCAAHRSLTAGGRGQGLPAAHPRLEDEELDAAAHVQLDAGDVVGEVGAEEADRVRDVLAARPGA